MLSRAMRERVAANVGSRVAFMYSRVARVGNIKAINDSTLTVRLPHPELAIKSRQRSDGTDYKSFKLDKITGLRFV